MRSDERPSWWCAQQHGLKIGDEMARAGAERLLEGIEPHEGLREDAEDLACAIYRAMEQTRWT